jgi:GntR family transcriptional repressor for pyruvate dehydrogenase complex
MSRAPGSGTELFSALARDATLSARAAEQLERLIVDSHLAPGDRLPSERELGERLGVSRTVVREAVRALTAKGLLVVRTGDGTYVQDRSPASAAEALGRLLRLAGLRTPGRARAIYEVRRPLEIAIAGLAAQRATAADVEHMRVLIRVASDPALDERAFVDADVQFHLALATATGNRIFPALLDSVSELMKAIREVAVVSGSREGGRVHHERILAHVIARDEDGARRAMGEHMDESERILDEALARLPPPGGPA